MSWECRTGEGATGTRRAIKDARALVALGRRAGTSAAVGRAGRAGLGPGPTRGGVGWGFRGVEALGLFRQELCLEPPPSRLGRKEKARRGDTGWVGRCGVQSQGPPGLSSHVAAQGLLSNEREGRHL